MSETVVKQLYFSVHGDWLADFARTRVSEGAWEHALKMLVEDCGMTHEQAIQILKGEATLTGVAEIGNPESGLGWKTLSPNGKVAKMMTERLDYLYGNVFKYKDTYWKPYATVSGWDAEDNDFACRHAGLRNIVGAPESTSGRRSNAGALRSLYYATTPERDMLVIIGDNPFAMTDILCEQTPMPPIWHNVSFNDPVEFLRSRVDAGKLKLPVRGAALDEPKTPKKKAAREEPAPITNLDRVVTAEHAVALTNSFLADMAAATNVEELREVERKYEKEFEELNVRAVPNDEWDRKSEAHKLSREASEKIMADKVRAQADECGGWYELKLATERCPDYQPSFIRVPKNAFLLWALRGFRFEDYGKERPEWKCVAGQGWKMMGDDPWHTDWMLGAGIPLDETYERGDEDEGGQQRLASRVRSASFDAKNQITKEWTGVDFSILSKGKDSWVGGKVVHPKKNQSVEAGSVAVVPNAGPDYYHAMISACKKGEWNREGLLICETGGKLAHLAVVGREHKCTVLMVPGALKKYRPGDTIFVDFDTMKITSSVY